MVHPRSPDSEFDDEAHDPRRAWVWLGLGLVTAPVFAFTPLLRIMGWFLSALVHELGHSTMGWLFGSPSVPAIRLDGHAMAVHGEQQLLLVGCVAFALASFGWRVLGGTLGRASTVAAVALYLALALTPAHETLFLLAGHGGEYAIAAVFLWRCATGGFTESGGERLLYGTLGWYLLGNNLWLSAQLLTSDAARGAYATSGSFGLTNDYLRLGLPLPLVAAGMGLLGLAVLPAVLMAARPASDN